jgi:23S rRNA (guanosine2251-2'-O)-methyltransferase
MIQKQESNNMVFGTRAVMEAIRAGKEVDKLFIQTGLFNDLTKELLAEARDLNIPVSKVPIEKLNRLTRKNHQGVVAFITEVTFASLDNIITEAYSAGKTPLVLVLDRVTDVRNFGAIVRTAECAGVDAVVIPSKGSAAINADAMKTSAGALNHLPVCREFNLKDTLRYLKEAGLQLVACTEKTDKMLYEADMTGPTAIVLGSEEDGISPEYLKLCDVRAKIPMSGQIESLNVSVSAGVIIYEAVRQRI